MTVYTAQRENVLRSGCLFVVSYNIYFSKNMDCPGKCEYIYCNA